MLEIICYAYKMNTIKCESCGGDHDGTYGSGRFCSRSCSTRRTWTEETRIKIKSTWQKKYVNTPFEELGIELKKRRILEEQDQKCNLCGIS